MIAYSLQSCYDKSKFNKEVIIMTTTTNKKTASVFTRVTPELKEQAEEVLNQLQIPMSTALAIFLQQVVNQRGIPFDIKLTSKPDDYHSLSSKQFNHEIQKGLDDFKNGNTYTTKEIRDEINGES